MITIIIGILLTEKRNAPKTTYNRNIEAEIVPPAVIYRLINSNALVKQSND
jgi:hypothetical protein